MVATSDWPSWFGSGGRERARQQQCQIMVAGGAGSKAE